MKLRNNITEKIILRISDKIVGHDIYNQLKFLNESEWWSEEKLKDYQNEKLHKLVNHAYNNVPYYTHIMNKRGLAPSDIVSIQDLKKLPILTKEIFKDNYPHNIRARNWKDYKILHRHSSGSTGNPIQYLMQREGYSLNKACNLRGWYWMGYKLGDKIIKISSNERLSIEKKVQDRLVNTLIFPSVYSKDRYETFITKYYQWGPKYLRSLPDTLNFISLALKENKTKLEGLYAINTTGNILFPEVRKLIEERFGVKIFDSYSCEGGPNYFECPTHECYHSSMEYGISEILDENLNEVGDGELGRLYTTDLWNYVTPFIRYDSADIVRKSKNKCSCGRELLSISEIIGRDNDVIISPNGKYLIAQTFATYFKYMSSIKQFQIYQPDIDKLEIRIKLVNGRNDNNIKNEIINYWKKYLDNSMNIRVVEYDEIPLAPSGKRSFVIRDKSIPLSF